MQDDVVGDVSDKLVLAFIQVNLAVHIRVILDATVNQVSHLLLDFTKEEVVDSYVTIFVLKHGVKIEVET